MSPGRNLTNVRRHCCSVAAGAPRHLSPAPPALPRDGSERPPEQRAAARRSHSC